MRNLAEYPVTSDELRKFLDDLAASFDPNLIGDMRPVYVTELKKLVGAAKVNADLMRQAADHIRHLEGQLNLRGASAQRETNTLQETLERVASWQNDTIARWRSPT